MRNLRLHANGHIISISVDDISFGMLVGNDAFSMGSDLIEGDPNNASVFSGDIYLTSECKVVDEPEATESYGVTITLTSNGHKATVTPAEFVADYLKQSKIRLREERLERSIALMRAQAALLNAQADGVDDLTTFRAALKEAETAIRVAEVLRRSGEALGDEAGCWGIVSPNRGPVGEPT